MSTMVVNSEVSTWRPKLIRLTQAVPPPDTDGHCYVQPEWIAMIYTGEITLTSGQKLACTIVKTTGYGEAVVRETPTEVAMLRDAAFGFKPALESVK